MGIISSCFYQCCKLRKKTIKTKRLSIAYIGISVVASERCNEYVFKYGII